MEIIVGTYEEFLIGYQLVEAEDNEFSLVQTFATRSHSAPIRCIATGGKFVVSGGADDRIFVYDMKTRKEIQVLMHHSGSINAVTFTPDVSHLFSGSDDGEIIAVKTNSWQIDGKWKKAHAGLSVQQISCHPSGKLALSLGSDLTLKTWNLIKGRSVYTTNLKNKKSLANNPDCVSWSVDGDYFTLTGPRVIEIWNVQKAGVIREENINSKPICVCWVTNEHVLIGLENGELALISVNNEDKIKYFQAHKQRVKSICYQKDTLATASSSGEITAWKFDIESQKLQKLTSINAGCRPTCIQILDLSQFGDDYTTTKEIEVENEKIDTLSKNEKKNHSYGTVKIEYEDEEDVTGTFKSKTNTEKKFDSKQTKSKVTTTKVDSKQTKSITKDTKIGIKQNPKRKKTLDNVEETSIKLTNKKKKISNSETNLPNKLKKSNLKGQLHKDEKDNEDKLDSTPNKGNYVLINKNSSKKKNKKKNL